MIEWISEFSGPAALLAFFIAFVAIAFWTYRPANKTEMERRRHIPFRETE